MAKSKKPKRKAMGATALKALSRERVYGMTAEDFGNYVMDVHATVAKLNGNKLNTIVKNRYPEFKEMLDRNKTSMTYLLGSASAKVLHSAKTDRWYNVVLYLSPADRSMIQFMHEFPHLVKPLIANLQKARAQDDAWKAFAVFRKEELDRVWAMLDKIEKSPITPNYKKPDAQNRVKPLTLCPFASPDCRQVCLNTSGQGGMERTDHTKPMVARMVKEGIPDAVTRTNDYEYFYLKGYSSFFGGEDNATTGARQKRTMLLWYIWATEGVIQNSFNDLLYTEALSFKAYADRAQVPMALRLNGTSDFPVHRLRKTGGELLVQALGRRGIICYDYTKDYARMKAWMASRAWRGSTAVVRHGKTPMRQGFPANYYMVFSWAEDNARLALRVLQKGGNIVMVFRRSVKADPKGDAPLLPTEGGGLGTLPTHINVALLSPDKLDRQWVASIVDGDATDLRFMDKNPNFGKDYGGIVVGLVAKGEAQASKGGYTDTKRRKTWKHFTNPTTLRREGDKVMVEIRTNPARRKVLPSAVAYVDPDILNVATTLLDGFAITTTAMGT